MASYVTITPPDLSKAINQVVDAVIKGARKASKQSLQDIKIIIQQGVKTNTLGLNPLSEATKLTRRFGKNAGATMSRPRKFGDAPLYYTGQTSKGIKVAINGDTFSLGFDDAATISYTQSNMGDVAYYHEYGFTIRGTYTKKQLAYLHILFRKENGRDPHKNSRNTKGVRVGVAYAKTVPPRPAWENATAKAMPLIKQNYEDAIMAAVNKLGLKVTP